MEDNEKTNEKSFVPVYPMKKKKVGQVVIFNNKLFDEEKLTTRDGTEHDVESLKALLKEMGFDVKDEDIYPDYDDGSAITKIKEIAKRNFESYNCFVMVFLSHGENGKIRMKSGVMDIQEQILEPFRGNQCPSLSGKPKIFIIQACRGNRVEDEALESCDAQVTNDENEFTDYENGVKAVTPAGADFLVCYSTAEGYVSYRNSKTGTWFIEKMVQVFRDYNEKIKNEEIEELDFVSLMTVVAERVAGKLQQIKRNGKLITLLQVPCTVSTLRKKIYFPKPTKNQVVPLSDEDQPNEDSKVL